MKGCIGFEILGIVIYEIAFFVTRSKEISNSSLILYPGVGHIPMEEIPNKTATDVDDWLTQQKN